MRKRLLFITEFRHSIVFKQLARNYLESFHIDTVCPGKSFGYNSKFKAIRTYTQFSKLVAYAKKNRYKYHAFVFWSEGFSGILYAFLVSCFRIKSPKIIIINLLIHPQETFRFFLISKITKFSLKKVDCVIVHISGLIKDYQERFNYKGKIFYIKESREYKDDTKVQSGDYIFSGGGSLRDWPTLIEVTRKLKNVKFIICDGSNTGILSKLPCENNVIVKYNVSHGEFTELLAKSKFVVVPFYNYRHLGGNMIFIQSAYFGKAVVASKNMSAIDYIKDGYNGLLVSPGDEDELEEKIALLSKDEKLLSLLSNNAKLSYKEYSTENFWSDLKQVIDKVMN